MPLTLKTRLRLVDQDQVEGWFPLAPAVGLSGEVSGVIADRGSSHPIYEVSLDRPLEAQESGQQRSDVH